MELRQSVDVLIHDETVTFQQSDIFIPMMNMRVLHGSDRLFYISIGHCRQPPALNCVLHMMKSAEIIRSLNYERLGDYLSQQMTDNKLRTLFRLTSQLIMRSSISNITSVPLSGYIFDIPLRDDNFPLAYTRANLRAYQHVFAPLSSIVTLTYLNRHETEGGRISITNGIKSRVISVFMEDFWPLRTSATRSATLLHSWLK